jgi:hypothetical protein
MMYDSDRGSQVLFLPTDPTKRSRKIAPPLKYTDKSPVFPKKQARKPREFFHRILWLNILRLNRSSVTGRRGKLHNEERHNLSSFSSWMAQ